MTWDKNIFFPFIDDKTLFFESAPCADKVLPCPLYPCSDKVLPCPLYPCSDKVKPCPLYPRRLCLHLHLCWQAQPALVRTRFYLVRSIHTIPSITI
ncbi:MAG: hypothetical protein LBD59_09465 [Prevotellaceae bacterium]|nr:hypothetical protein [Prevotellaceae bacterium]